jgi:putative endonuclease
MSQDREQARSPSEPLASAASVPAPHLELGRRGEALAAAYLEQQGYRLVAANFAVPIGRNLRGALVAAELDLVAYDGDVLCFIEVKSRASDWYASPEVNVDLRKQRQISRAARSYRRLFGLSSVEFRYDVLTVIMPREEKGVPRNPKLELLKSFWTDEKFRKRRWAEPEYQYDRF